MAFACVFKRIAKRAMCKAIMGNPPWEILSHSGHAHPLISPLSKGDHTPRFIPKHKYHALVYKLLTYISLGWLVTSWFSRWEMGASGEWS